MTRWRWLFSCLSTSVVVAACTDSSVTAVSESSTYSANVAGADAATMFGRSMVILIPNGWSEPAQNGFPEFASDVTSILFGPDQSLVRQIQIGLLGRPQLGTYRVRLAGTGAGSTLEFYGSFRISHLDGTSTEFRARSGTVTITEAGATIRGRFSFHADYKTEWPASLVPGTIGASAPASLDVVGEFSARMP